MLVLYVHHIGRALRVSALIELVGTDTRKLIDRVYPDAGPPADLAPGSAHVMAARKSGVITVLRAMTWDAFVHLAFDEIRTVGAGSPQVSRRLMAALNDLRSIAPPERVGILDQELALLRATARRRFGDVRDIEMALDEDGEGIGEAAGRNGSTSGAGATGRRSRAPLKGFDHPQEREGE